MTEPEQWVRQGLGELVAHYDQPSEPPAGLVADVLRARRRTRRLTAAAVGIAAVAAVAAVTVPLTLAGSRGGTRPISPRPMPVGSTDAPTSLGAMTSGPGNEIFVADPVGNRIFAFHPTSGSFSLVAGDGHGGFSGDGGPATRAELSDPEGMVYDRATGILYVADSGNSRIRAIVPSGDITTVVGGGGGPDWVSSGTPAKAAHLSDPEDVTVSPTGQLVIADAGDNEILALTQSGRLTLLAGNSKLEGVVGLGRPARFASPDGPTGLAYDGAGNLWITGQNTKTLLVITADGIMRRPVDSADYPRGSGQIQATSEGDIDVGDTQQIDQFSGLRRSRRIVYYGVGAAIHGIRTIAVTGFAVGSDGQLYFDTSDRDGFTNRTALFEVDSESGTYLRWTARRTYPAPRIITTSRVMSYRTLNRLDPALAGDLADERSNPQVKVVQVVFQPAAYGDLRGGYGPPGAPTQGYVRSVVTVSEVGTGRALGSCEGCAPLSRHR